MNSIVVKFARSCTIGLVGLYVGLSALTAQSSSPSISPADPTILVGQSQQFTATGPLNPLAVVAGVFHSCVSLPDRTLRCWGKGGFGQLGDGTGNNSSVPITVSGLSTALSVSTANWAEHTCALLSDQTARCWGSGDAQQPVPAPRPGRERGRDGQTGAVAGLRRWHLSDPR